MKKKSKQRPDAKGYPGGHVATRKPNKRKRSNKGRRFKNPV